MPIEVSNIAEADIPGAIDCIQQAFEDDPYNNWVFDKKNFSKTRNSVSLGIRCKWGIQHALFHVAKDPSSSTPDKILGVAMWMPPHKASEPESWFSWYGSWLLWARQVGMNMWYGRGGLRVNRYYIWKEKQAEAQSEIWTDENGYYFCNIVTVLPEAQGMGIGKKLFTHVTDLADKEGKKCYLESSRMEPNVAIYRKMGFEMVKEMDCDDNGEICHLFCMIREPQKA